MKSNGQTSEDSRDSGALSRPLSFVHNGSLRWDNASRYVRGEHGLYWLSPRSNSIGNSYNLNLGNLYLVMANTTKIGDGLAVRKVENYFSNISLRNSFSFELSARIPFGMFE